MNSYEGVFIVDAGLDEARQEQLAEEIKTVITKNEGEIGEFQSWGRRRLAYPIKKQAEGVYYLVEFKSPPEAVKKAETAYKLNDSIIRTLIIRKE